MASTISPLLRLELMSTGDFNSTWGIKTNSNLEHVIESSIAGLSSVNVSSGHTLTVANNAPDEARSAILVATGTLASDQKITIPTVSKTYMVRNATLGGYAVTIGTAGGAVATVPYESVMMVFCDGTDTYATADMGLVEAIASSLALKANVTDVALKAPIESPTFTGTVGGITKGMVGLTNVDNTTDLGKPVSTAQQAALDLKAPLASPAFTGNPVAPTQSSSDNSTKIATTAFVSDAVTTIIPANIHAADSKVTPTDADELPLVDSAASNGLKKLTWANLKAAIKTAILSLFNVSGAQPVYACRAWATYTDLTIGAAGNVSSITANGGNSRANFATAFADTNFAVVLGASGFGGQTRYVVMNVKNAAYVELTVGGSYSGVNFSIACFS